MGTKGKLLILAGVCTVMTLLCLAIGQYENVADPGLIRFHVIANSDTIDDQAIKLRVRDEVLAAVNNLLADAKTTSEANHLLADNRELITKTANNVLKEENCRYTASTVLGTSIFPTKTYGNLTLAAGKYNACKVVLGEGKGKNWWCVLYPPLCFVDIHDDTAVAVATTTEKTEENNEIFAVDGNLCQVKLKSKLLELLP